jgi:N-methylhydantoinase B/oxoprolinase/acetone carboxylase alpha subunit
MALVMMKTSYSTIFNEGLDFSTVILDARGDLIAEKNYTPSMMGAIPHTVKWAAEELGPGAFAPGDVLVHNDCYRGGCHLPEHMMIKPVFLEDALFGFLGNMGHCAEIGGKAPGSFASDATDVYQEGLRLPPVKLVSRGEHVEDIWRIILTNHRTPRNTWGDFHAMIGSLNVGERRLAALAGKYGAPLIREGTMALLDHSERLMRAHVDELPDGEYAAEMWVEDDGVTADPFKIRVTVVVRGDEILFDFTGSSPQVRGPMNCTFTVVAAAVYNAVFSVVDPRSLIPRNSGCYRAIRIIAPPGSVVNVQHPGPCVGGNTDTQPKIIDLLLRALAKAVPDRVAAASGGSSSNLLFGGIHPATGQYYSNYHFDGMGTGGTAKKDGNNGEITRHSNCRNTPVEVFETRYPFLTLDYGLAQDSGGPGRHRGGLGIVRTLEVTAPEITVSALFDRARIAPWGLFGGMDGGRTRLLVKRKGTRRFRLFSDVFRTTSPTKFTNVVLKRGDVIRYQTPGGGGYGGPLERDAEAVLDDVREGFVSTGAARAAYGVVVGGGTSTLKVDAEATRRLRRRRLRGRRKQRWANGSRSVARGTRRRSRTASSAGG